MHSFMFAGRFILQQSTTQLNQQITSLTPHRKMTNSSENEYDPPTQKPTILIHRTPAYGPVLNTHLSSTYTPLDPLSAVGPDPISINNYLLTNSANARALVCMGPSPLTKDTLDCLPSLECVICAGTGIDHVDLSECRRRGISVANVGDAFSDDVADSAVGLLIDVLRKVSGGDRFVRAGLWPACTEFPLGHGLRGKRVGIVGLGSIGYRVAKRLISFGCIIAYTSRHQKASVPFTFYDNVYTLALDMDILILSCSLTDQTHHMINKDVLTALGRQGVVINVGRGGLIDEQELVRFLVKGEVGGAGLDVYENEPSVPKELFGLDNVVLSPHNAVLTPESMKALRDIVTGNLEALFSNKPLLTPINWD